MRADCVAGVLLLAAVCPAVSAASEPTGERAVREAVVPVASSLAVFEELWTRWGLDERPVDFQKQVLERYGLTADPDGAENLPLGLGQGRVLGKKVLVQNCLLCHAGSIAGQTVVGLGNASLDFQGLVDDLQALDPLSPELPFHVSNVRGTVEATASTVFLNRYRNPDLSLRAPVKAEIPDELCEDIPPWWNLKHKRTMYHTGTAPARSVRSMMAFLLSPLYSAERIKRQEPKFREIQRYLVSIEPPKYPFAIDRTAAARGEVLFRRNCARCHGTYKPHVKYPNKMIPLNVIGTDPKLATAHRAIQLARSSQSWFEQEEITGGGAVETTDAIGYLAPPLVGIWASAPYFHNGSVPTVWHVLKSDARPSRFTRSYRTEAAEYDQRRLGWKHRELRDVDNADLTARRRRQIYDTTRPGRSNGGHRFGDRLTDQERMWVIEFLKTL